MLEVIRSFRDERHIPKAGYIEAHDKFYEPAYDQYKATTELLDVVKSVLEKKSINFDVLTENVWTHITYQNGPIQNGKLLEQGWKVHISANNMNCKDILRIATDIISDRGHQFKFANDTETLRLMTSKRWLRGGSGKFMTIYPPSKKEFCEILEELYTALAKYKGSYILSDRRYKDSQCVYYRYGGIMRRERLNLIGRKVSVISTPDGSYATDERTPFFNPPEWVSDPFPDPEAEEDSVAEMTLDDGRYKITEAMQFSNTGGVYLATDTLTGGQVIIKESRPGVGLSPEGLDATDRLAQEAEMLSLVKGTGVVPDFIRTFWDWENFYLVEEYFESLDMRGIMLNYTPLLKINPSLAQGKEFYTICRQIFKGILEAITELHDRGIIIGDLSATNILVEEESWAVKIIDLEGAFRPGIDNPQSLHTPGYRLQMKGREDESGFSDDLYAIGITMIYSIFPLAAVAFLRDDFIETIAPRIISDVGWTDTPILKIARGLIENTMSSREALRLLETEVNLHEPTFVSKAAEEALPSLEHAANRISDFIKTNYREEEKYTLFPNDPICRETNPEGFLFGSTGVIYAFEKCGFELPIRALKRYKAELNEMDPERLAPGFLTGSAGMAFALFGLGQYERARSFLVAANASSLAHEHHSLYYGMAGIGMAHLAGYHFTSDEELLDIAKHYGTKLRETARSDERGVFWEDTGGVRLGFGYGQSGVALFLLRLSQLTNDNQWRELGRKALQFDLACGEALVEPGVMTFAEATEVEERENYRTMHHYVEVGTAGIAKVAIRYGMFDEVSRLLPDCSRKYSGFGGLLYGLSSFVDIFTDAYVYSKEVKYLEMAKLPLRGLFDLHLFDTEDGLAAPGENLFRISCDLGTGLSGIMLTLNRYSKRLPDDLCLDFIDFPAKSSDA